MKKEMIVFFLLYNMGTFLIMLWDKIKAQRHRYRISEKFLLSMGLFFGAFGCILGMYIFHHKSKKIKFKVIFTLEAILNIGLIYIFLSKRISFF